MIVEDGGGVTDGNARGRGEDDFPCVTGSIETKERCVSGKPIEL